MTTISQYPCSQTVLFLANDYIIARLRDNLPAFSAFRTAYSTEFCDFLKESNSAAAELPNEQLRALPHERLHDEMVVLGKDCCKKFQMVKRYIAHSFPEDQQEMNWKAAGWRLYPYASNENWQSLVSMNDTCSAYIAGNSAALQANNNMPSTFAAAYNTACNNFESKYMDYLSAVTDSRQGTDDKVKACNNIFQQIMNVCSDAQLIYADDDVLREQFTFSAVCRMIAPPGAASATVTVVNAENDTPLIAEVQVQGTDKVVITDGVTGTAELMQLASGETVFNITADGYTAQHISQTLSPGTTSRITVRMVPMFTGAAVTSTTNGAPAVVVETPAGFN